MLIPAIMNTHETLNRFDQYLSIRGLRFEAVAIGGAALNCSAWYLGRRKTAISFFQKFQRKSPKPLVPSRLKFGSRETYSKKIG
jgi:hypothetical protein